MEKNLIGTSLLKNCVQITFILFTSSSIALDSSADTMDATSTNTATMIHSMSLGPKTVLCVNNKYV